MVKLPRVPAICRRQHAARRRSETGPELLADDDGAVGPGVEPGVPEAQRGSERLGA